MADLGKDQQAEPSVVVPNEQYDLLFKLMLVGDAGVGKSSVIMRYSNDAFTTPSISTMGKRGHVFNLAFLSSLFSLPLLPSVWCKIGLFALSGNVIL